MYWYCRYVILTLVISENIVYKNLSLINENFIILLRVLYILFKSMNITISDTLFYLFSEPTIITAIPRMLKQTKPQDKRLATLL